jgi:3-hydroxyacyl-CoA dehydrogenase/3a,7a,12a-trihydroxy-5b-cholest-24-enoyl-CoA hydratase
MPKADLEGRVVIVTGAGQGLGRCHADAFAARGAKVIVNDLGGSLKGEGQDASVAQSVANAINAAGGEATPNTDSVEQGDRIVQCALDHYGRVDVVVNNAGILRDAAFHKMTHEDWDQIVRVHLSGAFQVTRAAWPHMRSQGYGRVVMTASGAGIYGNFGQANYSAAKLGLLGFAQALAIEGATRNIRVNTIAPVAASRLTSAVMPPDLVAVLRPELVTPLVLFLSSESCEVTGQLFEVGGGCIARLRWERSRIAGFDPRCGFSPEDVAACWATIQQFPGDDHPCSIADSVAPIARHTGVRLNSSSQHSPLGEKR